MKSFLNYLGIVLLLLGVVCLVLYNYAFPLNELLLAGIITEAVGIVSYIVFNVIHK